ncbi:MAG: hypothetical protein L3J06_10585 [Cyclobacteriaceae bacterium]|nr:hypothetical protein [Cyclobacteriaceae bacterium]
MPDLAHSTNTIAYRYGYQGQFAEKDEETGWNHFELREYVSRIGRWLQVDPMRQYYSPFNGNGNNPIMNIDPTGGFNPIHGTDGKFRGYDSEGIGGDIIIYDGKFYAGMDQKYILNNGGILRSNFLNTEVIFGSSIPNKIDLENDPARKVMDGLINWSIYINGNKGRDPNGEPITLDNMISRGAENKGFTFSGAMNGANGAKRTINFANGSTATVSILDVNFLKDPNNNEVMMAFTDQNYVPDAIQWREWDGRSTVLSINFTDHAVFHAYSQRIGQ